MSGKCCIRNPYVWKILRTQQYYVWKMPCGKKRIRKNAHQVWKKYVTACDYKKVRIFIFLRFLGEDVLCVTARSSWLRQTTQTTSLMVSNEEVTAVLFSSFVCWQTFIIVDVATPSFILSLFCLFCLFDSQKSLSFSLDLFSFSEGGH